MFKKPSTKSATSVAALAGGAVAGAKLGDGIVAVVGGENPTTGRVVALLLGGILATCTNPATAGGQFVQGIGVGMAVKQGDNMVTEAIKPSIDAQDNKTITGRFLNAVIGHSAVEADAATVAAALPAGNQRYALNMPVMNWEPAEPIEQYGTEWDRGPAQAPAINFLP